MKTQKINWLMRKQKRQKGEGMKRDTCLGEKKLYYVLVDILCAAGRLIVMRMHWVGL